MIQFVLVTALVCAAAVITAVIQGKRARKALEDCRALRLAFWELKEKAERLQKALGETAKVGEEADEKRKELAKASDADLAGRANNLF